MIGISINNKCVFSVMQDITEIRSIANFHNLHVHRVCNQRVVIKLEQMCDTLPLVLQTWIHNWYYKVWNCQDYQRPRKVKWLVTCRHYASDVDVSRTLNSNGNLMHEFIRPFQADRWCLWSSYVRNTKNNWPMEQVFYCPKLLRDGFRPMTLTVPVYKSVNIDHVQRIV